MWHGAEAVTKILWEIRFVEKTPYLLCFCHPICLLARRVMLKGLHICSLIGQPFNMRVVVARGGGLSIAVEELHLTHCYSL